MLAMGVTGAPADILGRLADLRAAGADTVYFHLYDVTDLDHVRLLGCEILLQVAGYLSGTDLASARPPTPLS